MRASFALCIRAVRAAAVGAFSPAESQPVEVFDHGLGELGAGALGVEIFVAQDEGAVVVEGTLGCHRKGAGMADVEQTGGRRGETAAVALWRRIQHNNAETV